MDVIDDLLTAAPDGVVRGVLVGAYKTAVVVAVGGMQRCGLASTPRDDEHHYGGGPGVREAGALLERSARELAELARSTNLMEAAIGIAAINALLPADEATWLDLNAEEVIAERGAGKRAALAGHFPFTLRLRERCGALWVLKERPREDDLPAEAAVEIIPRARRGGPRQRAP